MGRVRWFATAVLSGLLVVAWFATRGEAQSSALQQVAPGVWFREGDLVKLGYCNNVIIEMKDHLIVVDANFPGGARQVLEDARSVSSKPVKLVFDTHHHGDHLYGNAVFTKMGAVTVAFSGVAEELKRVEPARWREAAKNRPDVAELKLDAPEPPQQILTQPNHVVSDGKRRVEFHFFGWAHTKGDGFVYLPKEKVLATGDAVLNGPYNYTGDANITNWPDVIRKAQRLDVRTVLPGHGPAGGKELLAQQEQFFVELASAVRAAVKAGKKLEDLVPMKDGQPGQPTVHLSPAVAKYVGDGFGAQVRDMFYEATTGHPAGSR